MAEVGLLAGLELVVRLVLVLVPVLQEVRSQGRREWMRKIGVDHNNISTDDAAPPGGHHIPSSGENPMSPAEAAEPIIPGGF